MADGQVIIEDGSGSRMSAQRLDPPPTAAAMSGLAGTDQTSRISGVAITSLKVTAGDVQVLSVDEPGSITVFANEAAPVTILVADLVQAVIVASSQQLVQDNTGGVHYLTTDTAKIYQIRVDGVTMGVSTTSPVVVTITYQ